MRIGAALLFFLFLPLGAVSAQEPSLERALALKRQLPPVAWERCPDGARAAETSAADRQNAERIAAEATQAAILGDNEEAYRQLARAAELDPGSAVLAYRLALALEQLERPRDAVSAYCRYLALEAGAPDREEVSERILALVSMSGFAVSAAAREAFLAGVEQYDAGLFGPAEVAFSQAARADANWSAPVFNRAVVRLAGGRTEAALDDLRQYLEMSPGAADFNDVFDLILAIHQRARPPYNPRLALASGIVVPGLGHFTTGRPLAGMLVLGSVGAALAAALGVERVNVTCLAPPENGRCAPDQILAQTTERPFLAVGIAAAAAVGLLGALDAYRGARRRNARAAEALRAGAAPARSGATVLPPTVRPVSDGVRMDLVRIRF